MQSSHFIRELLSGKGLKVTPQRVAILDAVLELKNHPSAEHIYERINKLHPNISLATVYKVLDILVEKSILTKVKTEKDAMRYDAILDKHHHLYCMETDRIEDYDNKELDELIASYFKKKKIKNFTISDIKLQITGTFK